MNICKKEHCTGCAACVNRCPMQCIQLCEDNLGHLYPKIDESLCIDCHLCTKLCQAHHKPQANHIRKAFAAWSLVADDRSSSTSGGLASVFSQKTVDEEGIVFGAVVDKGIQIHHQGIDNPEQLKRLKGSKYVHSHIMMSYKEAERWLKTSRKVLFTGTPCQIAGLRNYLGKAYDNLTTVDLICHGVPSKKILHDHLSRYCSLSAATSVRFRKPEAICLEVQQNGKIVYNKNFPHDSYMYGFEYGLFNRPSCFHCAYAGAERVSDITIGDFWGLGKYGEPSYSKKKVSVVLPNTVHGERFLDSCRDSLFLEERSVREAVEGNDQLQHPSVPHKRLRIFNYIYVKFGYAVAMLPCRMEFYLKYTIFNLYSFICITINSTSPQNKTLP